MQRFVFLLTVFWALSYSVSGQVACFDNTSSHYFVTKKIKKSTFKKRNLDESEKIELKRDLVNQITTSISVISLKSSQNTVKGNVGEYTSINSTDAYITSSAVINNPDWVYCRSGSNYYVQCIVNKKDFENDLMSSLNVKSKVFEGLTQKLNNAFRNKNSEDIFTRLRDLKKEYYSITNGMNFIASANTISSEERSRIINQITTILGTFDKLEVQILSNFDNKLVDLQRFLSNQQYAEVETLIAAYRFDNLSPTQQIRLNEFKDKYYKALSIYSQQQESQIRKLIRKRDQTKEVDQLIHNFDKISYYSNNQKKIEQFQNVLARRRGLAKSTLFIGLNVNAPYLALPNTNGTINLNQLGEGLDFEHVLPSYHVGLKHFISDPSKRIGVSFGYVSYANTFLKMKNVDDISNPIKNFTSLQAGLILGPFEFNYGPAQTDLGIDDLKLISTKFGLLRTDKLTEKFGKINYLNVFISADLLTNLKNENYFTLGFGLNYNLAFNRSARF